jgi:hypothetical protein
MHILVGNFKGRDYLKNVRAEGRVILKWIIKNLKVVP